MRFWRIWDALREITASLSRGLARIAHPSASPRGGVAVERAHGAAQSSLSKPWRPNPEGRRSVEDAVALARAWGIVVEDDVRIVASDRTDKTLDDHEDAAYAGFMSTRTYTWDDMLSNGKIVVKLRSTVLDSDEGIVDVLAHEMHEINALRGMFEARHRIPGAELISLTETDRPRNLHDQAWNVAAGVVRRFRGGIK